jgi:hypothetical protein
MSTKPEPAWFFLFHPIMFKELSEFSQSETQQKISLKGQLTEMWRSQAN